ncbi:hypothetical protein [Streptomyces sp. SA15]|uniref:hypothetical protein n=1 Tax=Streptomyces sp. SA15 TaxID=934019 RepID=UPI00211C913B|nr:hypothetical protein [Streptomyces sp. SA15]
MGHSRWIRGDGRWIGVLATVAAVCCLATTVVFAPGYMSPDSIDQLRQAMGKTPLTDWHPPVLSLVWRALIAVTGSPASMAVLQSVVFWGALWVMAWCVWELTASRAGSLAVLGLGLTPHVLTFVGVVWKDVHTALALLAACAVAFVGLRLRDGRPRPCRQIPACLATPCTHSRRTGRRPTYNQYEGLRPARREHAPDAARPALRADDGNLTTGPSPALRWGLLWLGVLFLAYAMLVRKNAFFAAIPVFFMLVLALWRKPGRRTWAMCGAALVVGLVVPATAISWIARPVPTKQGAQIMLDDLVHVLTVKELRSADVSPDLRNRLVSAAEKCDRVNSLSDAYWTCYERPANGLVGHADQITSLWMREMSGHVPGYVQYRLRLFTGLLFETGYPYQPGVRDNELGLKVSHDRLEETLETYVIGAVTDLRPLFRGWFWLALALVLCLRPGRGPFSMLIRALGVSAAAYVLGYLPIMPATNYRYVYWPAIACTLGLLLLLLDRGTASSSPAGFGADDRGLTVRQPTAAKDESPAG